MIYYYTKSSWAFYSMWSKSYNLRLSKVAKKLYFKSNIAFLNCSAITWQVDASRLARIIIPCWNPKKLSLTNQIDNLSVIYCQTFSSSWWDLNFGWEGLLSVTVTALYCTSLHWQCSIVKYYSISKWKQ